MRIGISKMLALVIALLLPKAVAECVGFLANGSTAARYDFYRFHDFRNLDQNYGEDPAWAASDEKSKIFSAVPWNSGWKARTWFRPAARPETLDMQYSPSEVFISNNTDADQKISTHLTLRTTRLPNGTQLAAELDYTEYNVTYASMRMLSRVRGASGAVAGFFTYHNDTTESDIEVLTRDPSTQVHYSNHPITDPDTDVPISDSTFNVSIDARSSTSAWNVHRLDWIPGRSAWYFNGAQTANTSVNVPDVASMIIVNMWSNGGNFSGRMDTGNEAWLEVQWIELLFNITTTTATNSESNKSGGTVCSAELSPGSPTPVKNSGASILSSRVERSFLWWLVGQVSVVALMTSTCLV